MSASRSLARGWGAEVPAGTGRDAVPRAARCAGSRCGCRPEPRAPPEGWEVFVSTALPGCRGRPRAELLAELVRAAPVDRRRRRAREDDDGGDDRLLPRAARPRSGVARRRRGAAARRERRRGRGLARRRGRRVGPSVAALRPQIAVLTNVDLDHHAEFALAGGGRGALRRVAARRCPRSVRGDELAPVDVALAVPGEHNRRNAAAALAALELAGVDARRGGARARASSRASAAGSSSSARPAASRSTTTTRTTRRRSRRRSRPRASARARARARRSSSRTSTRARCTRARARRGARRRPTSSPSQTSTRRASSRCRA